MAVTTVWKKPTLAELDSALVPLREAGPGDLVFYGDYQDVDTEKLYSTGKEGIRVAALASDPPLMRLALADSALTLPATPGGTYKFEWIARPDDSVPHASSIPPDGWPQDVRDAQARIAAGAVIPVFRTEAQTRKELIDPVLDKAGWKAARLKRDLPIYYSRDQKKHSFHSDYVLYADHKRYGQVAAAIIEATRESFTPDYGLEQGKLYADVMAANVRYVFATNGREFVQYDRTAQTVTVPRPLKEFPRLDALRELVRKIPDSDWRVDKGASDLEGYVSRNEYKLNGDNEETVANVARLLIVNNSTRQQALELMVASMTVINDLHNGKWGTTLSQGGDFIKLNVGRPDVVTIYRDLLHVVLDDAALDEVQRYEIGRYALLSRSGIYPGVPTSISCDFRPELLPTLRPMIQDAHFALIKRAAESIKKPAGYKQYHSPGVIDFLRTSLKRRFPHPVYSD